MSRNIYISCLPVSWELADLGFAPHICLPYWTSLEGYQRHVPLMTMSETEVKKQNTQKKTTTQHHVIQVTVVYPIISSLFSIA